MQASDASAPKVGDPLEVSFREYRPSDSRRFFEIMESTWPELTRSIHACSVEWYENSATWREVACSSGAVVGILFGKTDTDETAFGNLKMRLARTVVWLKLLLGLYGKLPRRLTAIRQAMSVDRRIGENTPDVDGDVTFFAVDAGHQRKGIGKALMDRFIAHAKAGGAKRISVYTIDPGSNLPFYEGYGFRRVSSFPDGFMSFSTGEEVTAMIYVLEL